MPKRFFLPIIWMFCIFVLSSIPGSAFPELPSPIFSVFVHLAEYFVLAVLWSWALKGRVYTVIIICFAYAVFDELHQYFVPYRSCSVFDIIVDVCGMTLGIFAGRIRGKYGFIN